MTYDEIPETLEDMNRVGETLAEDLREAGYTRPEDVIAASNAELAEIRGIGERSAEVIRGEREPESGRPHMLEDYWEDCVEAAERGLTYEGIARVAGIGVATLRDWIEENEEFSQDLKRARAVAERKLVSKAKPEFVLQTSYGYTKTEKREVEVDADVAFDDKENVTADFVSFSKGEDEDAENGD